MSGVHAIYKCKHGTVVKQCRCINPDKSVVIVGCPSHCKQKGEE